MVTGFITLAGIIVRSSIVLVDFIRHRRAAGARSCRECKGRRATALKSDECILLFTAEIKRFHVKPSRAKTAIDMTKTRHADDRGISRQTVR